MKEVSSARDSMINKLKKVVKELISPAENFVLAVYVFGSYAKGKEKAKSDIDLAFVFHERFYKEHPLKALQKAELLCAVISKRMNKTVDVVILNGYSLVFAYYTMKKGICVYEDNTANRILYEVTLENKYQDFMPFIQELRDVKRGVLIGRN
ncbi:MAG: nucleotidyltransferase domain-containing protein [Nitrospira sp.]|nr:nucleotidyltransferase domain-containing protein [Nitrospira sp.]